MQPQVIICKDRAEWLEARKDGLGASDAAALLGLSPWKTNVQLWEEKCGLVIPEDIGDKPYVRYGNDAEPLLRSFFALDHPEYRVSFTPYKIIKHQDLPFITCTPDGELEEIATGRLGIFHGMKSYFCQDQYGQIAPVYSISAGLDYPGIGPEHAWLHDTGRAEYVPVTDSEAVDAFEYLSRLEGIIPALESAHALGALEKLNFKPDDVVVLTVSGRGDKDIETYLTFSVE